MRVESCATQAIRKLLDQKMLEAVEAPAEARYAAPPIDDTAADGEKLLL